VTYDILTGTASPEVASAVAGALTSAVAAGASVSFGLEEEQAARDSTSTRASTRAKLRFILITPNIMYFLSVHSAKAMIY
jgi:hypothetical protein